MSQIAVMVQVSAHNCAQLAIQLVMSPFHHAATIKRRIYQLVLITVIPVLPLSEQLEAPLLDLYLLQAQAVLHLLVALLPEATPQTLSEVLV